MSDPTKPPERARVPVHMNRVLVGTGAPKPANKLLYAVVGDEIQLELGYYDVMELKGAIDHVREQIAEGQDPEANATPVDLFISERYVLSPDTALEFSENLQRLVRHLRKEGHLPAAGDEEQADA